LSAYGGHRERAPPEQQDATGDQREEVVAAVGVPAGDGDADEQAEPEERGTQPAVGIETPRSWAMSGPSPESMNSEVAWANTARPSRYSTKGMEILP
jgi:hypothetical protein